MTSVNVLFAVFCINVSTTRLHARVKNLATPQNKVNFFKTLLNNIFSTLNKRTSQVAKHRPRWSVCEIIEWHFPLSGLRDTQMHLSASSIPLQTIWATSTYSLHYLGRKIFKKIYKVILCRSHLFDLSKWQFFLRCSLTFWKVFSQSLTRDKSPSHVRWQISHQQPVSPA